MIEKKHNTYNTWKKSKVKIKDIVKKRKKHFGNASVKCQTQQCKPRKKGRHCANFAKHAQKIEKL